MRTYSLDEITDPPPPPSPADWNDDGVVVLPGFIPGHLVDAYCDVWRAHNAHRPGGFADNCPYMRHPEILELCEPLAPVLSELIGEPAGMNLNLTGWVTTGRDWHADQYLNPPHVGDAYAAVWIALDDVHPDAGPFQYVPGSHRWPQVTRAHIRRAMEGYDAPDWPRRSEDLLTPLFEREIALRGAEVVTHLPLRGDVLIWHGRLLHRGSRAGVPGMERRAFIAHFSGVHSREDMPPAQRRGESWYFPLPYSAAG